MSVILYETFHCTISSTDTKSISLAGSQSSPADSELHPPADRSQSVAVFTQLSLNVSVKQVSVLCGMCVHASVCVVCICLCVCSLFVCVCGVCICLCVRMFM